LWFPTIIQTWIRPHSTGFPHQISISLLISSFPSIIQSVLRLNILSGSYIARNWNRTYSRNTPHLAGLHEPMIFPTSYLPLAGVAAFWTIVSLLLFPILKLAILLVKPYFSNLRELPGPPGGSWITGHIHEMNRSETDRAECHLNWLKQYGHVFIYKSLLNVSAFSIARCVRRHSTTYDRICSLIE